MKTTGTQNKTIEQITPLEHYPTLAKAIGVSDLYFKREDLHPYGSHKGRSIPVMINNYYKKGIANCYLFIWKCGFGGGSVCQWTQLPPL